MPAYLHPPISITNANCTTHCHSIFDLLSPMQWMWKTSWTSMLTSQSTNITPKGSINHSMLDNMSLSALMPRDWLATSVVHCFQYNAYFITICDSGTYQWTWDHLKKHCSDASTKPEYTMLAQKLPATPPSAASITPQMPHQPHFKHCYPRPAKVV